MTTTQQSPVKAHYSPFSAMLTECPVPKYLKSNFNNDKHKKLFSIKAKMKFQEDEEEQDSETLEFVTHSVESEKEFMLFFKTNYAKLNTEEGCLKFTVDVIQNCGHNFSYTAVYEGTIFFDKFDSWKVSGVTMNSCIENSAKSILNLIEDTTFTSSVASVRVFTKNKEASKTAKDKVHENKSILHIVKRTIIARITKAYYETKKK